MSAEKPGMQDAYYNEEIGPLLPPEVAKFTGLDGGKSKPRKPQSGDVWLIFGEPCVIGQGRTIYRERDISVDFSYLWEVDPQARFTGFNVFDLLAGDPFAWAAALRFLPAPFLIEVRNGEEKREVMGLPKGCELDEVRLRIPTGHALVQEGVDGWMAPYVTPPVIGADFPTAVNAALKGEGDA